MQYNKRTHTCGELRLHHVGKMITLTGWVDRRRDLGGVIFIDLRDRYGRTQIVFQPQRNEEVYQIAKDIRSEFVISVTGVVEKRPDGTANPNLDTGEIDVLVDVLTILSKAETPPFPIEERVEASEELRLKYRYLDLRREPLQRNILMRHTMYQIARKYFDENKFVEVETPVLMKSTPEGARDYLVPSRIHRGKFYALPQSPQTYKQILMVAGFDKYFQIVKCFRDEDLRADRQPEFTQIDVEMSFIDEEDIYSMTEGLIIRFMKEIKGVDIQTPFIRLTYKEAMEKYGGDKPDLRFGLELTDVTKIVASTSFKVFSDNIARGGVVAGFVLPGGASYNRNQLDNIVDFTKKLGAGGLIYARVSDTGVECPIEKFVGSNTLLAIAQAMKAKSGDLFFLVSDSWHKAYSILGSLRLEMAQRLDLLNNEKQDFKFLWVTDFPLLEFSEEEKRYVAVHHPFTSPKSEDEPLLDNDPGKARARAYDLVLNGNEIAGGSIRIFSRELQSKMFSLLGINEEEAYRKFGFILDAFKYGAPPHGGIALGFDRIAMILAGQKSIRDVIAFPKTSSGMSLMDECPSEVDPKQLEELHIRIK